MALFALGACGKSSPKPQTQSPPPPHQQRDEDAEWRKAVAFDTTQASFSAQELVNYLNAHFPMHELNVGDRVYRCVVPGEESHLSFPAFFARTQAFRAYNGGNLCNGRNLYAYRVTKRVQLTQFLTSKRYELPNSTQVRPLRSVDRFHHWLHRGQMIVGFVPVPRYKAHILDNAIAASLTESPVATEQMTGQLTIGRVLYFCGRVLQDSLSRDHNSRHSVDGWLDYDPAFDPPDYNDIPISPADVAEKEEVLLCNPNQYLDPTPEFVRAM